MFKGNIFYYLYYRLSRSFFNEPLKVKINNFNLFSNHKKNKTSHSLLQKCNFFDVSEINTIKKLNNSYQLFLIDCGCNFGFYSFYTASLSNKNEIISIEASKSTFEEFRNNLRINDFNNIKFFNKAAEIDLINWDIRISLISRGYASLVPTILCNRRTHTNRASTPSLPSYESDSAKSINSGSRLGPRLWNENPGSYGRH